MARTRIASIEAMLTIAPPPARSNHGSTSWVSRHGAVRLTASVCAHASSVIACEGLLDQHAGVVDESVESAQRRRGRVDGRGARVGVGDVGGEGDRDVPGSDETPGDIVGRHQVDGGDSGALAGAALGDRPSDAAPGPGDDTAAR